MERHGSESYFVIGEGLLGETVGGRQPTLAAAAEALTPPFRFSRMGPKGTDRQLSDSNPQEDRAPRWLRAEAVRRRSPLGSPTSASSSTTTSRSTGRTSCSARTFPRQSCCRHAHRASTSTRCTGPGRRTPSRPSSTRRMACTCKMGKTVATGGIPAMDGFDLPRGDGTTVAAEARGDHPGSAERREPRGRPDAPRDDPVPQPRRRHASRLGAAQQEVRSRAEERHPALPVDAAHRLPAADLPGRLSSTTSSPTAGRPSRSGSPRPMSRRCRSSSRSRRSGSATP